MFAFGKIKRLTISKVALSEMDEATFRDLFVGKCDYDIGLALAEVKQYLKQEIKTKKPYKK